MARKAYTFIEYTFAESYTSEIGVLPLAVLKGLLDEFIEETNDKSAKIIREFVLDAVFAFDWNGSKGAFTMEFINERSRQTYFQARENFVAWAANKGVEVSYVASCDMPYELLDKSHNPVNKFEDLHSDKLREYFTVTLPAARGFTAV